jgi:hypothetical protein
LRHLEPVREFIADLCIPRMHENDIAKEKRVIFIPKMAVHALPTPPSFLPVFPLLLLGGLVFFFGTWSFLLERYPVARMLDSAPMSTYDFCALRPRYNSCDQIGTCPQTLGNAMIALFPPSLARHASVSLISQPCGWKSQAHSFHTSIWSDDDADC